MKKILLRLIVDILVAFSVIQGWWFVALLIGLISTWSFPYYIEILIAGVAYDSLFGLVPDMGVKGYAGTILAAAIFLIVAGFKKVVRR